MIICLSCRPEWEQTYDWSFSTNFVTINIMICHVITFVTFSFFFLQLKLHQKWTDFMFIPFAVRWYSFLVYFSLKLHVRVLVSTSSLGKGTGLDFYSSPRWCKYFPIYGSLSWFCPLISQKTLPKTYDSLFLKFSETVKVCLLILMKQNYILEYQVYYSPLLQKYILIHVILTSAKSAESWEER